MASPAAVVKTLLVTDLVESTRLVERLGDSRALEISVLHDRLARDLLARHGGREIDKTDGFLLLFDRPVDAVRYALAYHRGLDRLAAEEGVRLQARAGIHLGEVFLRENSAADVARGAKPVEVEGLAKPTVARLMALALPGQTLLTHGAYELSRRAVVGDAEANAALRWLAHGAYAFKGVEEAVEVFEVGREGAAPLAPPPGGEKAHRLLAPRRASRSRRLGIAAVVLAALGGLAGALWPRPPGSARPVVAVLGFKNLSGDPAAAWIATALSEILATELAAGDELRLIPGENVARMRAELALADGDTLAADTLGRIRENLGIDYVVTGSYLSHDGKIEPLSIRLQNTRDGDTVAVAKRVGSQEQLYQLVSLASTDLRGQLGVSGISKAQARAVQATLSSNPEATRLYSEGLARLRAYDPLGARDLLEQAVTADPQYALAYAALSQAWAQLGYDHKATELARRAFELSSGLPAEETKIIQGRYQQQAGDGAQAIETYRVLWRSHPDDVEHGLRLALAQAETNAEEALKTVAALRRLPPPARDDPRLDTVEARAYWWISDYSRQLAALDRSITKGRSFGTSVLVAEAEMYRGWALIRLGRYAEANQALEESKRLYTAAGDRGQAARTLVSLAIVKQNQGELGVAEELFNQALETQRQVGNRQAIVNILNNLSGVKREQGEIRAGMAFLDEAMAIAKETGRRTDEALTLEDRSSLLIDRGAVSEAREAARQALAIYNELGERAGSAWTAIDLAEIAAAEGQLASARRYLEDALRLTAAMHYRHLEGTALAALARVELAGGELRTAEGRLQEARRVAVELGEKGALAAVDLWRGEVLLAQGRAAEAEKLAREASGPLFRAGMEPLYLLAQRSLAEALVAQNRAAEAREVITSAQQQAGEVESAMPRLQLAAALAWAVAAGGDRAGARTRLEAVVAEASRLGLVEIDLAARLRLGRLALATGTERDGRARLEVVATAARERGFGLLARQAETALGRPAS